MHATVLSDSCADRTDQHAARVAQALAVRERRTTLLHVGTAFVAGCFVCPPGHETWAVENVIGPRHHLVFPSRPVLIEQAGRPQICADRNRVILYDAAQTYHRRLLDPAGDDATFVTVAPATVLEALELHGVATADAGSFGVSSVALSDSAFLAQRRLFAQLAAGAAPALAVEEQLVRLLDIVASACGRQRRPPATRGAAAQQELVEAVAALLAADVKASLRLADLGTQLHVSPYHLARVFRAHTGTSLHAYRERERLRLVVDQGLSARGSLSRLAQELGFSSHSHLSARFRRRFGTSPSSLARSHAAFRSSSETASPPGRECRA